MSCSKWAHRSVLVAGCLGAASAWAHEGHGVTVTHWHSTDVWGFLAVAVVFAGALAWLRGRQ